LFDKNLREDTFLSRSVIKQNIKLLKAREKWVNVSYTLLKKWFWKIRDNIVAFFWAFISPLFIVIFIYTIVFILYFNISLNFSLPNFSFNWLFAFIVVILLYLWIYFSKNLSFLILNFVILSFIVIFGVINF
jgi:hypothetical protein